MKVDPNRILKVYFLIPTYLVLSIFVSQITQIYNLKMK